MKPKHNYPSISNELKQAVANYIAARAIAETLREKVDAVYREILKDVAIYEDLHEHTNCFRITEHAKMWLSKDDDACEKIWHEADRRMKDSGLKPADMDVHTCPALVAESKVIDYKWEVVRQGCKHIGKPVEFAENIFAALEDKKFVELIVKMVLAA